MNKMKGLTLIATLEPITRELLGEKGAETSGTFHLSTLLHHVVPDPTTEIDNLHTDFYTLEVL